MYVIDCPHCSDPVQIESVQCGIFRHGAYKENANRQIPPHASKEECDRLVANDLIYGCGKPFRFDGAIVSQCNYI